MREITLNEARGRKIKCHAFSTISSEAVITFEDGSYTTLGIETGWDPGEERIIQCELTICEFGDEEVVALGLTSDADLENMREESSAEWQNKRDMAERAEYEKLKKKFGS